MSIAVSLPPARRAVPWRRVSMFITVAVMLAVLAAAWITPYDPRTVSGDAVSPPGADHPLGTNDVGQDLLSVWLYGGRVSLALGVIVALCSTILAGLIGMLSVLLPRGRATLLAATDALLAIPHLPLLVLIVALAGGGPAHVAVALIVLGWPAYARVIRTQVQVAIVRPYVEAARALGASSLRVARTCILPEIAPILWTKFLLTLRWAVLMEATLALLGLGDPAQVSWGTTLQAAFTYPLLFVGDAWLWWALPPAVAIAVVTLALSHLAPSGFASGWTG